MTHHLSTSQLEQFGASTLAEDELAAASIHTANCKSCHHRFIEELKRQGASVPVNFTLKPQFWFRNDHVDFNQLVGLADHSLDPEIQDIIGIHLKTCETCPEDVRSFLAFRRATAREMDVSYGRRDSDSVHDVIVTTPWWQRLQTRPVYAVAAAVLVAIALLIGVIALNKRSNSFEASNKDQANIGSDTNPNSSPSSFPSVASSPSIVSDVSAIAILKDASGEVKIDKNGQVDGLDELSDISRQQIARAALSERIDPATVLRDLSANESGLRGTGNTQNEVKLVYPSRRVVIEDRPVFKWESLPNATHYRVYVLDANGNQVGQSEELPPTRTQWKAPTSLRRGQVFSWAVTALVDGKEIVSPSTSAPEMKFAVLSTNDLQELSRVTKQNSHLALGVFYARTGLTKEAEREFQRLIELNPQSELPRRLLQSVRSMRNVN